jgi:RNA polymerase sigma factor (sigma-70 family)
VIPRSRARVELLIVAHWGRQYLLFADEDLISLVEANDAEAFATLYDRHSRGIDQLRSLASRRRTHDKIEATAPKSQPSEAFAQSWANSQREQVREALNSLPEEQLKTLELAYFSGYTHVEIAELLELPLGTVKGRMRLGLKKMKEHFGSLDMVMPR